MRMRRLLPLALLLLAPFARAEVVPLPFPESPANDQPYRVDSVYGPRPLEPGASFFHRGIDLNRRGTGDATGDMDMNEPIRAAADGTIFGVGRTSIARIIHEFHVAHFSVLT